MYKISIWLKGGGKIVEECDINELEAKSLHFSLARSEGVIQINKKEADDLPIILHCSEIAAAQIDEKYITDSHSTKTRKLETRV